MKHRLKIILSHILKKLIWTISIIILIMVLGSILLHLPSVQKKLAQKVLSFVEEKVATPHSIGGIAITLPNAVIVSNLYTADKDGDTLLYAKEIKANIDLPALVRKKINIRRVRLSDTYINLKRQGQDSVFNFQHYIDAFASDKNENMQTDSTTKMTFSIEKIRLNNIRFQWKDFTTKTYYNLALGIFKLDVSEFAPDDKLFGFRDLVIENTQASIVTHTTNTNENNTDKAPDIHINLHDKLKLANVGFTYKNQVDSSYVAISNANIEVEVNNLDFPSYLIDLKKVKLNDTEISLGMGVASDNDVDDKNTGTEPFKWHILANELQLENNTFTMKSGNRKVETPGAINWKDLQLTNINAEINNTSLAINKLVTEVVAFSFQEKSGFRLVNFTTLFNYSDTGTTLKAFSLSTPNSILKLNTQISYRDIPTLQNKPKNSVIRISLDTANIAIEDLNYFDQQLVKKISNGNIDKSTVFASGVIRVTPHKLSLNNMLAGILNTSIHLNGDVDNWQVMDSSQFNMELEALKTTREDIYALLPDSLLPENIELPENIFLYGVFNGNTTFFHSNASIETSYGNAGIRTSFYPSDTLKGKRHYMAYLDVKGFEVGKLLKNDTLGKAWLIADMDGSLDLDSFKHPSSFFNLHLDTFEFNGYAYSNVEIGGQYKNRFFMGSAAVVDSNLAIDANGTIDLSDSVPVFDFSLVLKGADLFALNFSSEHISARGALKVDFTGAKVDEINGMAGLHNVMVVKNGKQFQLDSVNATLENKEGQVNFALSSNPVRAAYEGNVQLSNLSHTLKSLFDKYFNILNDTIAPIDKNAFFNWEVEVYNTEFITDVIMPGLESFMPGNIKGVFDSEKNLFTVEANFPNIKYHNQEVDSLVFFAETTDSVGLAYSLGFENAAMGTFAIGKTWLNGHANKDQLQYHFHVDDDQNKSKYNVFGNIKSTDAGYAMRFDTNKLLLNYEHFALAANNRIVFLKDSGVLLENIHLSSRGQELKLSTVSKEQNEWYQLSITNFKISNITGVLEAGSNLVDGVIDGTLTMGKGNESDKLKTSLQLKQVRLFNDTAFQEILFDAERTGPNTLHMNAQFKGQENSFNLEGKMINQEKATELDMTMVITQINLNHFEPFVKSIFQQIKGELSGNLKIKGDINAPMVNGDLQLKNTTLTPLMSKSTIHISNEKLTFNGKQIAFNDFKVQDAKSGNASINGSIDFSQNKSLLLDLNFSSTEFMFLNTTYLDNEMYYGKVLASIDGSLDGTPNAPVLDMEAKIHDGTSFNIVIPGLNETGIEKEGVVRFVNKTDTLWSSIIKRGLDYEDTARLENSNLMELTGNIELEKGTHISIVIDPVSNEKLAINGKANMSLSIKGGAQPDLTGRLEIVEGTYTLMLYDVMRRTFEIKEGSNLQWMGDVMSPRADITAVYHVKTSPMPLLDQETVQGYPNNMPFMVNLNIDGLLLQPSISFDVSVPTTTDVLIQNKLSRLNENESERNKQVFSLLLFNSFMMQNTTSNRSLGYELNATARTSVSKLLTQQINSFSQRYIKGVDIGVAVNSYYNMAGNQETGRTDVSLDVSKQLFNNRLSFQVGGDINVEGEHENKRQDLSSLAGNVVVEYKLDKEGNYRIKGFSKTEYENIIDAEVNKTGVAFIFNKDLYSLKQLFEKDSTGRKKDLDIK